MESSSRALTSLRTFYSVSNPHVELNVVQCDVGFRSEKLFDIKSAVADSASSLFVNVGFLAARIVSIGALMVFGDMTCGKSIESKHVKTNVVALALCILSQVRRRDFQLRSVQNGGAFHPQTKAFHHCPRLRETAQEIFHPRNRRGENGR